MHQHSHECEDYEISHRDHMNEAGDKRSRIDIDDDIGSKATSNEGEQGAHEVSRDKRTVEASGHDIVVHLDEIDTEAASNDNHHYKALRESDRIEFHTTGLGVHDAAEVVVRAHGGLLHLPAVPGQTGRIVQSREEGTKGNARTKERSPSIPNVFNPVDRCGRKRPPCGKVGSPSNGDGSIGSDRPCGYPGCPRKAGSRDSNPALYPHRKEEPIHHTCVADGPVAYNYDPYNNQHEDNQSCDYDQRLAQACAKAGRDVLSSNQEVEQGITMSSEPIKRKGTGKGDEEVNNDPYKADSKDDNNDDNRAIGQRFPEPVSGRLSDDLVERKSTRHERHG